MKGRLTDDMVMPITVINPPPIQEMTSVETAEKSTGGDQHETLEMQPL